jgi:hypothetical protein
MPIQKITSGIIADGAIVATDVADGSITAAKIVSIANTQITGNIVSSQIAPSVTLTTPIISGNLGFDSTGTTGVRLPAANTLTFHTTGTEDMRITSNGDVGIGITNPAFRLVVQDASNATRTNIINSNNSVNGSGVYLEVYNGATQNSAVTLRADNADNFGILNKNGIQFGITSAGNLEFNSGYGSSAIAYGCRAWVNFNGTGTVAIRASGNVSSITDNATGDYTVNFTTAMPDANYSVVASSSRSGDIFTTNIATNNATGGDVAPTTGAIRVVSNGGPGRGPFDSAYFTVAVFR